MAVLSRVDRDQGLAGGPPAGVGRLDPEEPVALQRTDLGGGDEGSENAREVHGPRLGGQRPRVNAAEETSPRRRARRTGGAVRAFVPPPGLP